MQATEGDFRQVPWPRSEVANPRTRILQVTEDLGVGGLERVIATICRNLDLRLFDPAVVCLRDRGEFADELEAEGFPVFQLPYQPGRPDYFAFRHVAHLLKKHRVDVVHTHNTGAYIAGGFAALLARTSRLIHTDHARPFPDKFRFAVVENLLSRASYRVVGVSDHTTENLVRYERIPRKKLVTIHNGIDVTAGTSGRSPPAVRSELKIPDGHRIIGLGSRHTEQKNLPMLLEAFDIVRHRHDDVTLVVCGGGPLTESLREQVAELGLTDRVRFPGMRTDMLDILKTFHVYVMTSHWEGLPMALLEAMALGVPVVSTRVGGVADAVENGESGLLVEPGDTAGFAAAVSRLLTEEATRLRLAEVGRRRFEEGFSAGAMTEKYAALYARG